MGFGLDAVEIDRFERVIKRTPGFVGRVFRPVEVAFASRFVGRSAVTRLAARFAVKEAAMKALGVGLGAVALRDIWVERDDDRAPRIFLDGKAEARARELDLLDWQVSITHTESIAIAAVLGKGRSVSTQGCVDEIGGSR